MFFLEAGNSVININVYLLIIVIALLIVITAYFVWVVKRRTIRIIDERISIDEITGYGNLAKFVDDAEIMLKYKDLHYVVGVIDISNFKAINNFYGREQGDKALKAVAGRIHDIVIPDGIFARYFADRFVFMINYLDISSLVYVIETYLEEIEFEIDEI